MISRIIPLFCAVFLPLTAIQAGEYNPILSIGDVVQPWENLPATNGEPHSWKDLKVKKVVVVAFTCNTCPYAVDYQDRIKTLSKKWQNDDRVALIAVNSNLIDEDSLEAMKERAKTEKFTFPYLKDEKQELGKAWGATRTPEFFVIDSDRKVVYMGAMDDNPNAAEATVNYVDKAVEATLAGKQPDVQETVAIGCNIRYKRSRR
ncbi:thioredoxin family protein [Blastopirellula marina]|uniref:Thioredoxin family protein n=1 Tax=Blastopirellula marina TaxID=124 RepID=A0A2S8G8L2_9BACT|nr:MULTISPECIES: thioredoxin family protein [Pirellulaceae]PQO40795.1 thioredoxin family protein [Blastopirellula marina]RCS56122.1 thioredoxin family protein [Bremerella cremea]